jgi:hypothetical protein
MKFFRSLLMGAAAFALGCSNHSTTSGGGGKSSTTAVGTGGGSPAASCTAGVIKQVGTGAGLRITTDSFANALYWTGGLVGMNAGTVTRLPLHGGAQTLLAGSLNAPVGITVDSDFAYVVNPGFGLGNEQIVEVPIGGAAPTVLSSGMPVGDSPRDIVASAHSLYWTDASYIRTVLKTGGTPQVFVTTQGILDGIAIDSTNVYYAGGIGKVVAKVPLTGGAPTTLTSIPGSPTRLAVDVNNVYFLDIGTTQGSGSDGAVRVVPIAGGAPTALVSSLHFPAAITLEGDTVYWVDNDGTVAKVPKAGGSMTVLAKDTDNAEDVVVAESCVYWVTGGGQVHSTAK